jgi:hypothetical protein
MFTSVHACPSRFSRMRSCVDESMHGTWTRVSGEVRIHVCGCKCASMRAMHRSIYACVGGREEGCGERSSRGSSPTHSLLREERRRRVPSPDELLLKARSLLSMVCLHLTLLSGTQRARAPSACSNTVHCCPSLLRLQRSHAPWLGRSHLFHTIPTEC